MSDPRDYKWRRVLTPNWETNPPAGPGNCEWAHVVGSRIRRLRKDRAETLNRFCRRIQKPFLPGKYYSAGYLSRLERGWAAPPFFVYVAIAEALDVQPGHLLGPDDTDQELSQAEMTLIRFIRGVRLAPHDAIVRLSGPQHADR
ncbi:MAG: helix-turn-helix domain-containing protein [Thermoleophilaceae bacterium]